MATGQNFDDYFQRPLDGPHPAQTLESSQYAPSSQPSIRANPQFNPIQSTARSFLATSIHDQQTAPHPYHSGTNGRKGKMLLGAGFQPPSGYTNNTYNAMQQRREQRFQHQQNRTRNGAAVITNTRKNSNNNNSRNVDRNTSQRYAFSPREREQAVRGMLKNNDTKTHRNYNSPRTQGDLEWSYKDKAADKKPGRRYRHYKSTWDQPDISYRRPMARTEDQLTRAKFVPMEQTSLCAPRKVDVGVIPRVKQSIYLGAENQYQSRMMAARNHVNNGGEGYSSRMQPQLQPQQSYSYSPRVSQQQQQPRPARIAPNRRVPCLGALGVQGKVELLQRVGVGESTLPRFSRKPGPKQIEQGPINVQMPNNAAGHRLCSENGIGGTKSFGNVAAPEYSRVQRYGQSLRHGRNDRVALWKNPLSKRE